MERSTHPIGTITTHLLEDWVPNSGNRGRAAARPRFDGRAGCGRAALNSNGLSTQVVDQVVAKRRNSGTWSSEPGASLPEDGSSEGGTSDFELSHHSKAAS